jgi:hypothetical protein
MAFEPPMSNIPLWNLREEFYYTKKVLCSDEFASALHEHKRPLKTPILDWHGNDTDLLSLLVQRAILGVESYTIGAAWIKLSELGRMTTELNKKVRNPFSIHPKSGTASAYYHHLPSLLHPELSVAVVDPEFWAELKGFYSKVRNPLFHGSNFARADIQDAIKSFWFVEELYSWLDQWHKPEWVPGQRLSIVLRANA